MTESSPPPAQCANGAAYCQLLDAHFDGVMPMHKVRGHAHVLHARMDYVSSEPGPAGTHAKSSVAQHQAVLNYPAGQLRRQGRGGDMGQLQGVAGGLRAAGDHQGAREAGSAVRGWTQGKGCRDQRLAVSKQLSTRLPLFLPVQDIEVARLSKGSAADNLELLQWLSKFLKSESDGWGEKVPGTCLGGNLRRSIYQRPLLCPFALSFLPQRASGCHWRATTPCSGGRCAREVEKWRRCRCPHALPPTSTSSG
jgi:hypothetical protein